jgi:hypothetical protein
MPVSLKKGNDDLNPQNPMLKTLDLIGRTR